MNENKKVLIVDDDPDILELLNYNLEKENYKVKQASSGLAAIEVLKDFSPHLIILDVMMPEMDGIECCRKIREMKLIKQPHILFLTARSEEFTEIAAWDAGGNDFVTKPIRPRALLSRIQSILNVKAKKEIESNFIEILGLQIDKSNYSVKTAKETVYPSKKEFELLFYLASKPNKIHNRDEILSQVWEEDTYVLPRTIDVHIRKLRSRFGDDCIKTIKGVGYMFVS